ncbi:alpha/beta hydrolase [Haloferula helveola]
MKPILLLFAAALVSCAATIEDVPYVENGHELQKLDIHAPLRKSESPRPVVVAIHGGGWAFGDKSNSGFLRPKTGWFKRHGFVVVSVNYRLSPEVTHPGHIEDVCKAIAWVEKNIAKHGGDPQQIYLIGHSAGAHLAALAAVDQTRLKKAGGDPAAIRGVILIDGACYDVPRQMRSGTPFAKDDGMYAKAFTTDTKVQRDASPASKVTAKPPPFLILHVKNRRDSTEQSEILARALRKKGGKVVVEGIYGKNHMTINSSFGLPDDATTKAAAQFLGLDE